MNLAKMTAKFFCVVVMILPMPVLAAEQALPPRAEADIVRCATPPRIDGDLSDACWARATQLGKFRLHRTQEETDNCRVRICADDQWLYISYDIVLPNAQKMQPTVIDRDGHVSGDDSVEVFLDPGTQGKFYYHFMLSAANVQAERICYSMDNKDLAWSIPWRSATKVGENGWQAEIAIPLGFLAKEPTWKNLAMNLCLNRFLLTIDNAGARVAVKRENSSWSAVVSSFHETQRFGLLHKLDDFKAKEAFMAMVEQTRVGKYTLTYKGEYGYEVSGVLRNASGLPGKVALVVEDKPDGGKATESKREVELKPSESQPFTFFVPVTDFASRTVTVKLQDAANGEVSQSCNLREAADLRLLRSYPRFSYYTSEKEAEITCEIGLQKEALKKLKLSVKTGAGKEMSDNNAVLAKLLVPMKELALGANAFTVVLSQADGKELARQDVTLVRRTPKPGCEYKMDLADKVLLDNGKPFFVFGVTAPIHGKEDEAMMKDLADMGFNTIRRWLPGTDHTKLNEAYEMGAKYGIKIIETPYYIGNNKVTREQLQPRTNMTPEELTALQQDLVLLPAAKAVEDQPNLLAYFLSDEPGADLERAAENLRLYQKLYAQDGYHPCEIMQIPPTPEGEMFSRNCDIMGIDPFWTPGAGLDTDVGTPHRVGFHTWAVRCRADRDLKLASAISPCAERWSGLRMRIILEREQFVQTYLALIHGAKGFIYFPYPFIHQGTYDAFKKLGREMKVLGPACLAHELEQTIAYSPIAWDPLNALYPEVQVSLKQNPAGGYILLAANWKPYPVDADIELPALAGLKKVKLVFDAQREFAVEGGRFSDRIEAMGTRAYAIDAKDLAEPVAIKVALKKHPENTDPLYAAKADSEPRQGKKNFFSNSSFEQDSAPGLPDYIFDYYGIRGGQRIGDPRGDSGFEVVAIQPHEGQKCLRMAGGRAFIYEMPSLQPGQLVPVVFSLYARTDDEKGASMSVKAHDANGTPGADGHMTRSGAVKLTPAWQRIVLPVTMPLGTGSGRYYFEVGPVQCGEGKSIYIDAMQLEKGTQATEYER